VVPSRTGKGSGDIVCVVYSNLLFPVLLFSFILVFVIITFWAEKRIQWFIVALVNAGRSFLLAASDGRRM